MTAITDATLRYRSAGGERLSGRPFGVTDIGVAPPIEIDGGQHTPHERRRVSLRWLAGTVLTGLAGAGLIGASIYAALDRKLNSAETPEFVQTSHKETTDELVNPAKGNRLMQSVNVVAAKQSFHAPTTIRVGDKSVVQVRTFTNVATTLETTSGSFADKVPPFNPMKLITGDPDQSAEPAPDPAPVQDDEEISFKMRDLADVGATPAKYLLTADEIQAQIADELNSASTSRSSSRLGPQWLLMHTSNAELGPAALGYASVGKPAKSSPFSSIAVRMVPENETFVPRSSATTEDLNQERLIIVHHGDTLESILRAAGATPDQIAGIVAAFGTTHGQSPVTEGQRLMLQFTEMGGNGRKPQIGRLSVYNDETLQTTVALDDAGQYVEVKQPKDAENTTKTASSDDQDVQSSNGLRLYDSLYETALKQNVPPPIINELVHIFANDVDFERPATAADSLDAFYEDSNEGSIHDKLLFASLTTRNATFKYFRFRTPDDGVVDYYDEDGHSSRKFLLREPVDGPARMSSPFGLRMHPILGYTRMHTGVDWAAPIGTPIVAAGDGTVIKAGRESGYGNRIEIQHANGYITTYSHLESFARGIRRGVTVHQGQVIAYLGMTGLATGPHLHYEVVVNGHFVDPLRIKLPRSRELAGGMLADFKRERNHILRLMAEAPGYAPLQAQAQR